MAQIFDRAKKCWVNPFLLCGRVSKHSWVCLIWRQSQESLLRYQLPCLTQALTFACIFATQATLAGQAVPGICLGLSEISSSMGLQAQVTMPSFKMDPRESKLRPHTFRPSTLPTEPSLPLWTHFYWLAQTHWQITGVGSDRHSVEGLLS